MKLIKFGCVFSHSVALSFVWGWSVMVGPSKKEGVLAGSEQQFKLQPSIGRLVSSGHHRTNQQQSGVRPRWSQVNPGLLTSTTEPA